MSGTTGKIIQIAVGARGDTQSADVVYALADDGTLWRLSLRLGQAQWYLLPPLPTTQPDPLKDGIG